MTLGGILVLLLLVVSLAVFIYLLVVTVRGWGWLHSILLSLLFIECWVFMIFTAGVQYRRVRSAEAAAKAQASAEQALAETQRLLWGDYGTSEGLDSMIAARGELRRVTADRGRVWRQLNFVQAAGDGYQLEMLIAPPAEADPLAAEIEAEGGAAEAPPPIPTASASLPANTVVYGFAEQVDEQGRPLPVFYLGEFNVTESQDGLITLEPTLGLEASQTQYIADGEATLWTLYELLPQDAHAIFAAEGSKPSEEELFGRMDEEMINTLMAGIPEEDGRRQAVVASYLHDGQRAIADVDPEENVWLQVNVLKETMIDVDSQEVANATERGYFDTIGRSIDVRLKQGEEGQVRLHEGMRDIPLVLQLSEQASETLIGGGFLEVKNRFYVRPLVDYEEALNELAVRKHDVSEQIALYKRDSSEIERANALGQEMISFRQVERQKLESDLANYRKEIEVLNGAVAEADQRLADLKQNLSTLYRRLQTRPASPTPAASPSPSDAASR